MINWDHNAGAPLLPEVRERLAASLGESWGHPGSIHQLGRAARDRLDDARARVAAKLGASSPREVLFTSSGSEAAATALLGTWLAQEPIRRRRIVSTSIEHPAVLGALQRLERWGAQVHLVPPSADGAVDAREVIAALDDEVLLCSVMWANNETGVVLPVEPITNACRERGICFHTDAVQAVGKADVHLGAAPIDLLSLSAHKLGGPPGAGVLYVRRGIPLAPLVPGHQEHGRRGGTPSVLLADAAALAIARSDALRRRYDEAVAPLRARFEAAVTQRFGAVINGAAARRLANTSSVTFPGVDAEALLVALDLDGIAVSTGAACASGTVSPSHVLLAMGLSPQRARSTLRFSLGPEASEDELDSVLAALDRHLPRMSGAR